MQKKTQTVFQLHTFKTEKPFYGGEKTFLWYLRGLKKCRLFNGPSFIKVGFAQFQLKNRFIVSHYFSFFLWKLRIDWNIARRPRKKHTCPFLCTITSFSLICWTPVQRTLVFQSIEQTFLKSHTYLNFVVNSKDCVISAAHKCSRATSSFLMKEIDYSARFFVALKPLRHHS